MGREITQLQFNKEHHSQFQERMKAELNLLQHLLNEGQIDNSGYSTGVELEAWIVDQEYAPVATNEWLLSCINHEQVVTELSRYIIEINGTAYPCGSQGLTKALNNLQVLWEKCQNCAQSQNSQVVMIGTLPTANQVHFPKKVMAPLKRYEALNQSIFLDHRAHEIVIKGENDKLNITTSHIMPASAATSMQFHFKVPIQKFVDYFNITQFVAPFTVALSANAPLLFGKGLWDESRIPLFEHAINSAPSSKECPSVKRSFFGDGYLQSSIIELYKSNLENYPVLLPALQSDNEMEMSHLNLHNGTIWRWNRPVLGLSDDKLHARIEHRGPSSGPTMADGVANLAFYLGLVHQLAKEEPQICEQLPHRLVEHNFYRAAQRSLSAQLIWTQGQKVNVAKVILEKLLPMARKGLADLDYSKDEISYLLDSIITNRVKNMQNGANWQKSFIAKYGKDYQALVGRYIELQHEGHPVHTWNLN